MDKGRKIMILVANPVKSSFSYACGDAYAEAARSAGAEVRRFNIDEIDFDPTLHNGYKMIQELEPDLIAFRDAIAWADHLVFIYPNWWSTMPAKMKGLFDRAFLPGFAFKFEDGSFKRLLRGKSGRIINISGSLHPFHLWWFMGSYTNELSKGILRMCGVRPVRVTSFGPTRSSDDPCREKWLKKVAAMGVRDSR